MRKTTVLLAVVLLSACSKSANGLLSVNKTYCWKCLVKQVTTITGQPSQTVNSTTNQCNLTETQADQLEKSMSNTTTSSSGGISVKMTTTATCSKQ